MEFHQLQYFSKIAELQNITQAAGQLHISQPALSKSIRNLEEDLNTQLFLRKGRNIYLTPNGQIFYERVQEILNNIDSVRREMDELANSERSTIRIMLRALGGCFPEILSQFLKKNPEVQVTLYQGGNLAIPEFEYDLIVYPTNHGIEAHNNKLLLQEDICLAIPSDDSLSERSTCSLQDIVDRPYIHTTSKSRIYGNILDDYFHQFHFQPQAVLYCDNPHTIIEFVRNGRGITLIPEYSISPEALANIRLIPLEEGISREIYLKWSSGAYLPAAAQKLSRFLIHYFQTEYGNAHDQE